MTIVAPSTAASLVSSICTALGRSDAETQSMAYKALNWSIIAAAILFKPRELNKQVNTSLAIGQTSISLPSIITDSWISISDIFKTSTQKALWMIPYSTWQKLVPTRTGVMYYTIYGTTAYFNTAPSGSELSLTVVYRKLPDVLDSDGTMEFIGLDGFVMSASTMICQAIFEEDEAAETMRKIVNDVMTPGMLSTQEQALLEHQIAGGLAGADNIK